MKCGALIPSSVGNAGMAPALPPPTFHPFLGKGSRGSFCAVCGVLSLILGFSPARGQPVSRVGMDPRHCCPFPHVGDVGTDTGSLWEHRDPSQRGSVGFSLEFRGSGAAAAGAAPRPPAVGAGGARLRFGMSGQGCRDVGTGMLVVQPVPAGPQDVPALPKIKIK